MAVEITSEKELTARLARRSEYSYAVANRAALRVLPIICNPEHFHSASVSNKLSLGMFRGLIYLSSRSFGFFDDSHFRFSVPRSGLAGAAASEAIYSIGYASDATFQNRRFKDAAPWRYSVLSVISAANCAGKIVAGGDKSVWSAVSRDCDYIEDTGDISGLGKLALWEYRPVWFSANWAAASRWLSRPDEGFEIWREWYFGRLEGLPHAFSNFDDVADEAFYRTILKFQSDWWSREPAEVNADIRQLVDSLRTPKDQPDTRVDFFISYASENEVAAREVAAVLDDLGKSYIVQYRDFPQANFVNAMNDAMERSDRLIALYSTDYIASPHCNAEWNYYYNLDPSSVERRIVGLKLDHAALKPLMEQIDYRDLTGMNANARRQAIAEWLAWQPSIPSAEEIEQNPRALSFRPSPDGHVDLRLDRSADQLDQSNDARMRHAEAKNEAKAALDASQLANTQARDPEGPLAAYIEALGENVSEISASVLVSRGEKLRRLIALRDDPTSFATPFSENQSLALQDWQTAHNLLIGLDPYLAGIERVARGPDTPTIVVELDALKAAIETAKTDDIPTDAASQALTDVADNVPSDATPDDRRYVQATEAFKNFIRAIGATLKQHGWKIGAAGTGTAYAGAAWVQRHMAWLKELFANEPSILSLLDKIGSLPL